MWFKKVVILSFSSHVISEPLMFCGVDGGVNWFQCFLCIILMQLPQVKYEHKVFEVHNRLTIRLLSEF